MGSEFRLRRALRPVTSRAHFDHEGPNIESIHILSATAALSAPPAGVGAPYTVGIHPVDDLSASGTTQWPYMPTRSPRRPACPSNGLVGRRVRKAGGMVRKRGYAVSRASSTPGRAIGDSPQLYTQNLAVPGPAGVETVQQTSPGARATTRAHEQEMQLT